jgi:diguanylate cyclase (GGDEF)-like protein
VNNSGILDDPRPVFDALPSPAAIIGPDGRVIRINGEWLKALGDRPDLCDVGAPYAQSWPRPDGGVVLHRALTALFDGEIERFECEQSLDVDDDVHTVLIQMRALTDRPDHAVLVVQVDISVERDNDEQLMYQATHDPLTGVANRSLLYHRLTQVIERAKRFGDEYALLYLDLDRFKDVNDRYGHAAGDELLRTVAQRWHEEMRATDLLARVGGDEFVVLMERVTDEDEPRKLADRLAAAAAEPVSVGKKPLVTMVSVGIATATGLQTVEDAIAEADAQMYRVKRARSKNVSSIRVPGGNERTAKVPPPRR